MLTVLRLPYHKNYSHLLKMTYFAYIVIFFIAALWIFRKIREYSWGFYNDSRSLKGKTFLITGASSGIGKETAKQLAKRDAKIILANRNMETAEEAIKEIRNYTTSGELISMELDLASLESIRKFADQFNKTIPELHVLINNAGVAILNKTDKSRTKDGFEMTFGTNHLGHFLLTELLLPKLKKSAPSRIVIVTSETYELGELDLNDLDLEKRLRENGFKHTTESPGYVASKLANVYHGRELAARLKNYNIDVSLICPGWTFTNLSRSANRNWRFYLTQFPRIYYRQRSAWQGSQTVVMCATSDNLPGKSGDLYRNCDVYKSKVNFDDKLQKGLWEISEKLVKLS